MIAVLAGALSGNLLTYAGGPLYSWYFFDDLRFWKYRSYFSPVLASAWSMAGEWLRTPAYRRMLDIPLTAPPRTSPDPSLVRVSAGWQGHDGSCGGCARCCVRRGCPLLDTEKNRCRSYGSFFWRYFNCGRYPERDDQICYYDCEKWEIGATS